MIKNPVRESAKFVVKNTKDVKINLKRIKEIAKEWAKEKIAIPEFSFEEHYFSKDPERMLDFLILLDAMNFCFWSQGGPRWTFKYKGRELNGYAALATAFKIYFEKNPQKSTLEYFSKISLPEFKKVLQGGDRLLFLKKRWQILKNISKILIKNGGSLNFIQKADRKLSSLVPMIARLPSFEDVSNFKNRKIFIWKRAQIVGADIMGAFKNGGVGHFEDPEYLTAFADYKVPQILHTFGILEYSSKLVQKILKKKLVKKGSVEEVEIRSSMVWAVELLTKELRKNGRFFYPYQVDWILWHQSRNVQMPLPYHRTKTWFY